LIFPDAFAIRQMLRNALWREAAMPAASPPHDAPRHTFRHMPRRACKIPLLLMAILRRAAE